MPLPGNRISVLLARSLVSIQNTLPRLHFTCSYLRKYFSCALMLGIRKDARIYLTFCKVLRDTARGCPGGRDKAVVHTTKKRRPAQIGVVRVTFR